MSKCRTFGYEVALVFVALDDVDLHIRRVEERVAQGGHGIPESVIRRRYRTALANLPAAIELAHDVLIFDNSGLEPETLVLLRLGTIARSNLRTNSHLHRSLAFAAAKALHIPQEDFFKASR
jgi:predicted ABC-type ATPase